MDHWQKERKKIGKAFEIFINIEGNFQALFLYQVSSALSIKKSPFVVAK
jgi:hypothetical protein